MQGRINYTAVGFFVVLLTAILFVMIFWLTAYTHTKKYSTYIVYVHDDVTGLSVDSPVRFNGVQVGIVKSIKLDQTNAKLVKITLNIEPEVRITTGTYAVLNAQGITGIIYVNLKTKTEQAPILVAQPGEPFPVIPAEPSLFMQFSTVMPKLTRDINKLSNNLAVIFDKQNAAAITASLKNFETFSQTLAVNSQLVEDNLKALHGTLLSIRKNSDDVAPIVKSFHALSDELIDTSKTINRTAKSGDQVLNNFLNQILPSAQQTITEMQAASSSVHVFMDQLQHNPSILIRGRGKSAPGPGE